MRSAYDYLNEAIRSVKPQMAYDGGEYSAWANKARAKLVELVGMDKFTKKEFRRIDSLQRSYEVFLCSKLG